MSIPVLVVILLVFDGNSLVRIIAVVTGALIWIIATAKTKYKSVEDLLSVPLTLQSSIINDQKFYLETQQHDKKDRTLITVFIDEIRGYDFTLKRETWLDGLSKYLKLNRECQTQDDAFDERIYIISDNPQICERIGVDKKLREAIFEIFLTKHLYSIEIDQIACFNGRLSVYASVKGKIESDPKIPMIEHIGRELILLSHFFPSKEDKNEPVFRETGTWKEMIARTMIGALIANGGFAIYWTLFSQYTGLVKPIEIMPLSLKIGTVVSIVFVTVIILLFRKSSHQVIAVPKMIGLGILGIFLTTIAEVKDVNMYFDISKPKITDCRILSKEVVVHKSSRGRTSIYHMLYTDRGNFGVRPALYEQAQSDDIYRIYNRKGYLGYEWIEKIELVSPLE